MEVSEIILVLHPYIVKGVGAALIIAITYGLSKALPKIFGIIFGKAEVGYVTRTVEMVRIILYLIAAIAIANILAPEALVFSFLVLLIGLATIFMFVDLLRNIGAELYVRARDIVRRGDWIEVDGVSVKIVDFDIAGVVGETLKFEKVFIPYTKLLSSVVINRVTPLGMLARVYIDVPLSYGIDGARNMLLEALEVVKEDVVSEPDITYIGSKDNKLSFVIEFHIINYRKLAKMLATIDKEVKQRIPEAIVKV